ncbi:hypothetical protein H0V99_04060 [Candidatus Saccharibacteria bacterium]|nr:hypothetical protein [Candidatus Saccharibacteria bacterium]
MKKTTGTSAGAVTQPLRQNSGSIWKRVSPYLPLLGIGFIIGLLWLVSLRFFLVQSKETHYHANFAVYIDGVREEFKDVTYYEEVAACSAEYGNDPKGRVHMHDEVSDVIHVHDKRVTYADLFHNVFWTVGDEVLETRNGVYQSNDMKKLIFMLNGQEVDRIDTRVIADTDQLLISYGDNGTDLTSQYKSVSDSAVEVNKHQDPATCSGLNGPSQKSFFSRLKRALAE